MRWTGGVLVELCSGPDFPAMPL